MLSEKAIIKCYSTEPGVPHIAVTYCSCAAIWSKFPTKVVDNRATQDTFQSLKEIIISDFYILFFELNSTVITSYFSTNFS